MGLIIMFTQQLSHLSESDCTYISRLINKLETEGTNNLSLAQDCLWRIASNAELFPFDELDSKGRLTDEQTLVVREFIREFTQQQIILQL